MSLIGVASADSVWRGMEYYEDKMVALWNEAADGTYDGVVEGSNGNSYVVHVDKIHPRKSTCTCPFADGLEIVNSVIIPALDEVGKGFEQKKIYLPQLLMSAEAAKCAFEQIKLSAKDGAASSKVGFPVVLATVKGDVHDIGKNIVKLLLENYGYDVVDLGKDVPKEKIVDAVRRLNAPIAGLSALMTTTVPAMEETIELLRKEAPGCKVVVGGAVLTEEYAQKIGADKYSADAMETVRYAERLRMDINSR